MMYLLDTNVVSELRKAKSRRVNQQVYRWAANVSASAMFLSAVSILELELGILLMERRDCAQGAILRAWMENHVLPAFEGRVLAVDVDVARRAARLHVPDPHSQRDALIAATALAHGMTVATRNVEDFEKTGVALINPWTE
jgi:predicted nucleic acid-binding protein